MMERQHQPAMYIIWVLLALTILVFSPAIYKLARDQRWFATEEAPIKPNPATLVWVDKHTGFYYCPGSELYGKASPGISMAQSQALAQGYRPAVSTYCK